MEDRLPMPFGPPVLRACMRARPEHFFVEELPAFEPTGVGEHLLLSVEKRGMNTAFVAKRIAEWAGIAEMAVSYAGLKDRHAVTRQRFSVQLPGREAPELALLEIGGDVSGSSEYLRVLEAQRHSRKLQRGALRGNRFVLRITDVAGEPAAVDQRVDLIRTHGFPNYFGEQRFGREAGNLDAARRMFAGHRVGREQRSMLLSAARSHLFNRVLAARVADGSWNTGLPGEVWMLEGSHSVFGPEPDLAGLSERARTLDIHPTGPMWGAGALRCDAACRLLEEAALASEPGIRAGLERAGLKQERRALRVAAPSLTCSWPDANTLVLAFELPPGCYATSLLHALGDIADGTVRRDTL